MSVSEFEFYITPTPKSKTKMLGLVLTLNPAFCFINAQVSPYFKGSVASNVTGTSFLGPPPVKPKS